MFYLLFRCHAASCLSAANCAMWRYRLCVSFWVGATTGMWCESPWRHWKMRPTRPWCTTPWTKIIDISKNGVNKETLTTWLLIGVVCHCLNPKYNSAYSSSDWHLLNMIVFCSEFLEQKCPDFKSRNHRWFSGLWFDNSKRKKGS